MISVLNHLRVSRGRDCEVSDLRAGTNGVRSGIRISRAQISA